MRHAFVETMRSYRSTTVSNNSQTQKGLSNFSLNKDELIEPSTETTTVHKSVSQITANKNLEISICDRQESPQPHK